MLVWAHLMVRRSYTKLAVINYMNILLNSAPI